MSLLEDEPALMEGFVYCGSINSSEIVLTSGLQLW